MLSPKRCKMNILTYLSPSIHFDSFSLELGQFEFDGTAGVCGWYLELEFELISDKIMSIRAFAIPFDSIFAWLNFEPIVVLFFIILDVQYNRLVLLSQSIFPLFIHRSSLDAQQRNVVGCLFNRTYHRLSPLRFLQ